MAYEPLGGLWLQEHFKLYNHKLLWRSYAGTRTYTGLSKDGTIEKYFQRRDTLPLQASPIEHVEFMLRHEPLHLDFLKTVFGRIAQGEILAYIQAAPSSRYSRRIGYLYEFLTGNELPLSVEITGTYTPILEPERYLTGKEVKITRWHVTDNLLGTRHFCPIVRKTDALAGLLEIDLRALIDRLAASYPAGVVHRATSYLYTKETRSSYAIENENPSPVRVNSFIALLSRAGEQPASVLLSEGQLKALQNSIVDQRFAAPGFRNFQNYIGQSLLLGQQEIHYVCPPPEWVPSLMDGLKELVEKTEGVHPVVRAALVAFGFVFIHPFEDGNGRLHRYLIHEMLTRDGVVPNRFVVPISARMLHNRREYDEALEAYSSPLLERVRYTLTPAGEMEVTNSGEVEGYFRCPDLTAQATYLARTLHATVTEDMVAELEFLFRYDELKGELQHIVDMPDRLIDRMILYLHQNSGTLAKRRREEFSMLEDAEIQRMQQAYQDIFEAKK